MRTINQLKMVDKKFLEEANRRARTVKLARRIDDEMPKWWNAHNRIGAGIERVFMVLGIVAVINGIFKFFFL